MTTWTTRTFKQVDGPMTMTQLLNPLGEVKSMFWDDPELAQQVADAYNASDRRADDYRLPIISSVESAA